MSFTFNTYKGHREFGKFNFDNEKKKVFLNSITKDREKTPTEKTKEKVVSILTGKFQQLDNRSKEAVENYRHMNGFVLLNPTYIAAVLAMQIYGNTYIKIKKTSYYTSETIINNDYFNDTWENFVLPSILKIEKKNKSEKNSNKSKDTILKIKIEMLNYALKMYDYHNVDEMRASEIASRRSNEELERDYQEQMFSHGGEIYVENNEEDELSELELQNDEDEEEYDYDSYLEFDNNLLKNIEEFDDSYNEKIYTLDEEENN